LDRGPSGNPFRGWKWTWTSGRWRRPSACLQRSVCPLIVTP
jgi:hypothetical protein